MATTGTEAQVSIAGQTATYVSPEGQTYTLPLSDLLSRVQEQLLNVQSGILPRNVVATVRRGRRTLWIGEFPPAVYSVKWITDDSPAPFGPGTQYSNFLIGLPYVIVIASYEGSMLGHGSECFFRTAPLSSWRDELLYPALLNVSSFRGRSDFEQRPLCWICDQYLDRAPLMREPDRDRQMLLGWRLLTETLWDSAFNRSSEKHEGSSWHAESRGVDPRISSIGAWAEATRVDPLFSLDVPFLPTGLSLQGLIDRMLRLVPQTGLPHEARLSAPAPSAAPSADDLARLIVNRPRLPRRPK